MTIPWEALLEKMDHVTIQVTDTNQGIALLSQEMKHVRKLVDGHEERLKGNGDLGLTSKVANLEEASTKQHDLIYGIDGANGLRDQVKKLVNSASSVTKAKWIAISATIGGLVSVIVVLALR